MNTAPIGIDTEKVIKKYNREIRANTPWNRSSDEKMRTTKMNEEGNRTVIIGSRSFGCEIIYRIEGDTLFVSTFEPQSGGIITTFSPFEAEKGLIYILGLASVLKSNQIVLQKRIYDTKNMPIFRKFGFKYNSAVENEDSYFTFNCHEGLFHILREKHLTLLKVMEVLKKNDISFKGNWVSYNSQSMRFKYEYYLNGIDGSFYLEADIETGEFILSEDLLDTKLTVKKDNHLETTHIELTNFFDTIKEKGSLMALMKPSDVIFMECARYVIHFDKKYYKEVFTYLSEVYEQEELDRRLLEKDYQSMEDFRYSEFEIHFCRILDIYVLFDKKQESLQFFSAEEAEIAKQKYLALNLSYHKQIMEERLTYIK